jgi:hypothetical protein
MPIKDREKRLAAQKAHYYANKQRQMDLQRERRDEKRKFIQAGKHNKPCTDCGIAYPHYVMDYDHLPEFEKVGILSEMHKGYSMDKILEEIAKCELVCKNCHAVRTWNRAAGVNRKVEKLI